MNYRRSPHYRGFWGKEKSALIEIRANRGLFSTNDLETGETAFQSPLFHVFGHLNLTLKLQISADYRKSSLIAVFWGKGKTALCEIRAVRGMI